MVEEDPADNEPQPNQIPFYSLLKLSIKQSPSRRSSTRRQSAKQRKLASSKSRKDPSRSTSPKKEKKQRPTHQFDATMDDRKHEILSNCGAKKISTLWKILVSLERLVESIKKSLEGQVA